MAEPVTCSGRTFTAQEVELMRQIASDYASLGVTEIARTVCELLEWKRPGGGLKNHECRLLLEQLRDAGQLTLPAVRPLGGRGPRRVAVESLGDEAGGEPIITGAATGFHDLELTLVEGVAASRAWRECVERHHYLGCPVPYGAHLRYWIQHRQRRLGCLLCTSPAWRMKPRDEWIGWTDEQRRLNLQRIVNNGRFLILPGVKVTGLASMVLARCARQLPTDWEARYGYRPWLLETLVETERFKGTCYRAANWIRVGQTAGRGRMDRLNLRQEPIKDIYVYPLVRNPQQLLRGPTR
jgi:Domain of unknown function (DUF4338)